jgi:hypothetical protein
MPSQIPNTDRALAALFHRNGTGVINGS